MQPAILNAINITEDCFTAKNITFQRSKVPNIPSHIKKLDQPVIETNTSQNDAVLFLDAWTQYTKIN